MKTYIQSNVLEGYFYKLDNILRDDKNKVMFKKKLSYYITKNRDLPHAIDRFSDYLTKKLFGVWASRKIFKAHNLITENITCGPDTNIFRMLLIKINKRKVMYDPRTGNNNLKSLSPLLINDINCWLNTYVVGKVILDPKEIDNIFVRNVLYFVIRAIMGGIAIRLIEYGKYLKNKSWTIYKNFSKGGEQYVSLCSNKLMGGILFRGIHFKRPITYSPNALGAPMYTVSDLNKHLRIALDGLAHGFSTRGTSWSTSAVIAKNHSGVPLEFKNETFGDYLHKLKSTKKGGSFQVNCDDVLDIKKILLHGINNTNKVGMDIGLMLSYPLINRHSSNYIKEPLQLAINIGKKSVFTHEQEIILLPKHLILTNNGVDAKITVKKFQDVIK